MIEDTATKTIFRKMSMGAVPKIITMVSDEKNNADWNVVLFLVSSISTSPGIVKSDGCVVRFSRNTSSMDTPIAIEMTMESTSLIIANSAPITVAVSGVDSNVIPGPAKRKVIAGPNPAPFFHIPAKRGRIVHEQTSNTNPLIAAKVYATAKLFFPADPPIYFRIVLVGIRALNAPDMKNAGIKHSKTCAER
jgi:hypothetical protein